MLGFRRRYLALGVILMLISLWSCVQYEIAKNVGPTATTTIASLADSIRTNPPNDTMFVVSEGRTHARVTDDLTLPWNHRTGSIYPHRNSHRDTLFPGKVLARLQMDGNYGNLQAGVWYYWVVVDTSTARVGKLASLYVMQNIPSAADARNRKVFAPHFIGHLSVRLHQGGQHLGPLARWLTGSDGVGWVSCTTYGCCCGDQHCEKRGGP